MFTTKYFELRFSYNFWSAIWIQWKFSWFCLFVKFFAQEQKEFVYFNCEFFELKFDVDFFFDIFRFVLCCVVYPINYSLWNYFCWIPTNLILISSADQNTVANILFWYFIWNKLNNCMSSYSTTLIWWGFFYIWIMELHEVEELIFEFLLI